MSLDSLLADLKREYLDSLPQKIDYISQEYQLRDYESVVNEFHKLKGNGRTYGLPEVSELGEIMEVICKIHPDEMEWAVPAALTILETIRQSHEKDLSYDLEGDVQFHQIRKKVRA